MAAAESRPARQRIASRCLVQDDADGAPRLAWCPSSTSVNILGYENTAIAQDYHVPEFMPSNRNPMNPNLSPETKGRLQLQPIVGCLKDFTCEQLSSIEWEYTETAVPTSKLDGGSLPVDFIKFVLKREDMVSTASMKSGSGTRVKEPLKKKTNMDFVYKVEKLLELKPVDQLALRKSDKASSHLETPGSGCNKPEAWWRIADKDDLALLVAQKSLQHIENCDLPKSTQTVHYMKDLFSSIENLDASEIFQSSFGICNANEYSHDSSSTGSSDDMNLPSGERGCLLHDSEKLYRQGAVQLVLHFIFLQVLMLFHHTARHMQGYVKEEQGESKQTSENDRIRAQLLEALRHSQTRSRKAEMAAQKTSNEKEHIVKLFFRQASHLLAYKQWLRMLQLEDLCLQFKMKDHQISTFVLLPSKAGKDQTTTKGRNKRKCDISKHTVVALAVGLGLGGLGLLLGWTIGWLFPIS
ncbi:hypothetical protein MUK42_16529 [Musa troglodytarum]|uniref:Uncharacterized protein n=1 Tax=Musa troglodytarum TaxID=320322 RepID=A0A9E7FI04_9LILI|nr:hypothetical protein MUK42_16529 [Musa troglodytarum]